VRAWQAKGCPAPATGTQEFGSFESWREVVGGILTAAGIAGFLDNLEDARQESDQESANLRGFLSEWNATFGLRPVFVSELVTIGRHFFMLHTDPHRAAIQVGKILTKYQNQVYDGRRIQRLPTPSAGKTQWQLQAIPAAP
jgi:hypothetical protein